MRRPFVALVLLPLLTAGLLAACSGCGGRRSASRAPRTAEDSLAVWRAHADSLEATLGSMDKVEQPGDSSTGAAGYTAWFDSGAVRVVHETVDLGKQGSGSNRYYFERGEPRLTVEQGTVLADTALRDRLWANVRRVRAGLTALGFRIGATESPIVPIEVGNAERAIAIWTALLEAGVYTNIVLPPACRADACLLRTSYSAAHTPAQIDQALGVFERVGRDCALIGAAA